MYSCLLEGVISDYLLIENSSKKWPIYSGYSLGWKELSSLSPRHHYQSKEKSWGVSKIPSCLSLLPNSAILLFLDSPYQGWNEWHNSLLPILPSGCRNLSVHKMENLRFTNLLPLVGGLLLAHPDLKTQRQLCHDNNETCGGNTCIALFDENF